MSTGSAATPQLKAAPDAEQIAERLAGGVWAGLEVCLGAAHVASDAALDDAVETVLRATAGADLALTAEAPVSWPQRFVSVDRLDDEARAGIQRSARFAAAIGSPVLTIHLYAPMDTAGFRASRPVAADDAAPFLRFYAQACADVGVAPLIENVPPILRMRTGGVYLTPIGGHWRDLLACRDLVPELGFTLDTSHAALFRAFAAAQPSVFGMPDEDELDLDRYVDELGDGARVAHVSNAHGILGEGLPYDAGELDLDPIVRRLAEHVDFIVAEINEPDPARSPAMKAAYRAIERALEGAAVAPRRAPARVPVERFDWQPVVGRRDPVPAVLELQERFGGRRIAITGGGGSIARALATLLTGFRPERVALIDSHEPSLAADRRARSADALATVTHALCDIRDGGRIQAELERTGAEIVFHLAAYKHVDWAEVFPDEFVDTNLHGSWNVLAAADATGVETVVVASTDKAALAASFYGRTKRFMEQLTAFAARRAGAQRIAVRLVNVLGSAGSASELFLRQARAGVPLTVTDPAMVRYWFTLQDAALLVAHAALLAADGALLATPADPVTLSVGELADRIWRAAGRTGGPPVELLGIRRGETLSEVLTSEGERLGPEGPQGIAPIVGEIPIAGAAWIAERLHTGVSREQARPVWREAMQRPGLLAPASVTR